MITASVIGGTGYMGFELLRLLCRHPAAELLEVTSRTNSGMAIAESHPSLKGFLDIRYSEELSDPSQNDVIFVAAPHGASMEIVPKLLESGVRVIDLSGDYRLGSAEVYEKWYGKKHTDPENLSEAVYGLTELNRSEISGARLVANPGCYPTGAILSLSSAANLNAIGGALVVDSKSGTSGAGISPTEFTHHPFCASSVLPYKVGKHRHTPEIEIVLRKAGASGMDGLSFTPHLVPIVRGIETSCYFSLADGFDFKALREEYRRFASRNLFVEYVDDAPRISSVTGSNKCHLTVSELEGGLVAAFSVIDNLCKGGSGQAIQNMNVMFGFDEKSGLDFPGLGV